MRRWLGLLFLLALLPGCVGRAAPESAVLQPLLRPYDAILRPRGVGPFPAVVLLHGCLGVRSKDTRWAETLREQGYVALIVDSMTGRRLTTLDQRRGVCQGMQLWGGTRAADVAASLAYLRTLPDVDPTQLGVMGFSHGAWAALDFLAGASDEDVRGLHAVIGFYPYCGVASRARWLGWQVDVPTLLLLAADDHMVSPSQCRSLAARASARGRPVSLTIYPDVGHVFDWRPSPATEDAHRQVAAFLAAHLAPRRSVATERQELGQSAGSRGFDAR
jgi:dienelactone hydrolase